jgi:hypothetical protein
MMKKILLFAILAALKNAAFAQSSSSAGQSISLNLSNAIAITFVSTNTDIGNAVALPFSTVSDYTNGVTSAAQQLKTQSNKPFNITVAATSSTFTYSGIVSPAPSMPVNGVLAMEVSANNTGGTIAPAFSTSFAGITNIAQNIIATGTNGGNEVFSVQYHATPGFAFPSGSYSTNVIYTATQP